ncbi:MAG: histidine phosphatase family protein [Acidobacteria bacterium]|nr:histidine phosphatase family protein [Acidobacteriota bacterium]
MSTLTLVRHGQASFLEDNYDRLSPLGEQQARLLADFWINQGTRLDRVFYGPCERQIRTGEIIADRFRAAGREWPEPVTDPEFDEFPAELLFRRFMPRLMAKHPHLAASVAEFQTSPDERARQRAFDRVLREVTQRWLSGEAAAPDIPTWQDFCARIERAVDRVKAACPKSGHAVVFTSGGPTAAASRLALGLSYEATLELTWSPKNGSFTDFLFTTGRFSLHSFNNTPHLDDPALITYR